MRDVGSLNLALAVFVGWAAWTLDRRPVAAPSVGYLCNAVPHLVFHVRHLEHFAPADAIGQTVALAAAALIPVAVPVAVRRRTRLRSATAKLGPPTSTTCHYDATNRQEPGC